MKPQHLIFGIALMILLLGSVSALDSIGTFQKQNPIRIVQVCSDATFINISSISYPNSSIAVENVEMVSSGSGGYYYDFNTSTIGRYDVRGISDGCEKTFAVYFDVTTNGKQESEGIVIVFFSLIFILIFGFGLYYFIKSLSHVLQLEMDILDCTIMIATYLSMWMFYYISSEYLYNPLMNNMLELAIDVGAITHVFLPIVGFLLSFIMTNLKAKQKARITY